MTKNEIEDWRVQEALALTEKWVAKNEGFEYKDYALEFYKNHARLAAENATPVEDEAETLHNLMLNTESPEQAVAVAIRHAEKCTAALQAELDRANNTINRILARLSGWTERDKFAPQDVLHILKERTPSPDYHVDQEHPNAKIILSGDTINDVRKGEDVHRMQFPDTPCPAVVITDEHRQTWVMIKRMLTAAEIMMPCDALSLFEALFAESSS